MESRRDVFQAIADPTRREIISMIAEKTRNLNALADHFEMSRQAVSLHVKILRECGLIAVVQQGRERYCSLRTEKLAELDAWLAPFRKLWEDRFEQLDHVLITLKSKKDEK